MKNHQRAIRDAVLAAVLCGGCALANAQQHIGNLSSNPYGAGNPYAPESPTNPFGRGLKIIVDE